MRGTIPPDLPGQEAFFERLEGWLAEVSVRGPRLALVRGAFEDAPERVAHAFVERARRRGHAVLLGRAGPPDDVAPFVDVARAAGRWLRRQGRRAPPHGGDATGDRAASASMSTRLDALRALLGAVSADAPAVVCLDDLAHAGPGTVEVLAQLLGGDGAFDLGPGPDTPPVLYVAALSDDAGASLGGLPENAVREVRVEPLREEAVAALLSSPDFVRRVVERTRGHVRLVDALVAGASPGGGAPAGPLVEALAVLARPARPSELAAVAGGVDGARPAPAAPAHPDLDVDGEGRWRFVDAAARDAVYRAIAPDVRRALHARAAATCAPLEAFRHARLAEDHAAVVALAPRAADDLAREGALASAAELIEHALPFASEPARTSLRARAVELLWGAGDWPRAIPLAEEVVRARPEDPAALLRLGRLLEGTGRRRGAEAAFERAAALADAAGEPAIRLEVALHRAEARYRQDDLDGARALAERAMGAARALGRVDLVLDARNVLAKVSLHAGELEEATAAFEAQVEEARRAGSGHHLAQALGNLGITVATRGDVARGRALLEEAVEVGGRSGAPFQRAMALRNLAWLEHVAGDLEAATRLYQRAVVAFKRIGDRDTLVRLAGNLASLHLAQGDLERAEALEVFARGLLDDESPPVVRAEVDQVSAHVALAGGRLERARELLEGVAALGPLLTPWLASSTQIGLAEVEIEEGRVDAVVERIRRVEGCSYPLTAVRVALLEAELARATGAPALPLARRAADLADRSRHPIRILEAEVLLATTLADEGKVREARALLERVAARQPKDRLPRSVARKIDRLARRLAEAQEPEVVASPAVSEGAIAALVGGSPPMARVRAMVRRVARSDGAILVTGESGTGKELVARAIHDLSDRARGPFLSVNCAAFVDGLVASELFGHERGAFTGAERRRRGKFELAHGGTLFLDEVGDVSPPMQAALLRVLQEGTFERVGGTETLTVDVRIVSATNRDLNRLVAEGRFRQDLLYRLRVVEIQTPPLRERLGDLPQLVEFLLARVAAETRAPARAVSDAALARLASHPWPGNVRELDNALRAAVALGEGPVLGPDDFAMHLGASASLAPAAPGSGSGSPGSGAPRVGEGPNLASLLYARIRGGHGSIYELRKSLEREMIERALAESGGNITRAAKLLGMKRPRLSQLLREYGIERNGGLS